jgi:hypothetical protein
MTTMGMEDEVSVLHDVEDQNGAPNELTDEIDRW